MKDIDLFASFPLAKGFALRNRLAMAPMTTWAGNRDGTVSGEEVAYFQRRAQDVGLQPRHAQRHRLQRRVRGP